MGRRWLVPGDWNGASARPAPGSQSLGKPAGFNAPSRHVCPATPLYHARLLPLRHQATSALQLARLARLTVRVVMVLKLHRRDVGKLRVGESGATA